MIARRDGKGAPVELVVYPGATHAFDIPRRRARRARRRRVQILDRRAAPQQLLFQEGNGEEPCAKSVQSPRSGSSVRWWTRSNKAEQIVITRYGKPVARLIGALPSFDREKAHRAVAVHPRGEQGRHARPTEDQGPRR
jgi:hypothetical protein